MIIAIRIAGRVGLTTEMDETLHRMRLRKKYVAVLMEENVENKKLLEKVRNLIAYGTISKETLENLLETRGKSVGDKKINVEKIMPLIGKKPLEELGVKPFFRLHPPRKGIESKKHFGKGHGVLGDNKEAINQLVERML